LGNEAKTLSIKLSRKKNLGVCKTKGGTFSIKQLLLEKRTRERERYVSMGSKIKHSKIQIIWHKSNGILYDTKKNKL